MATARAPATTPLTPADYRTDRGQAAHRRRGWLARLPAAAGAGYLVAWIAGLAAWPSNLAP